MKYSSKVALITFISISALASASEPEWLQSELTENYMRSLTKDQCIEKTIASLKSKGPDLANLKTLAGITGDCVEWAQGTKKEFCKSFKQNYIKRVCSTNVLDARDCLVLHTSYEITCLEPKFK